MLHACLKMTRLKREVLNVLCFLSQCQKSLKISFIFFMQIIFFITFILKSTFLDSSPKRFSTSFIFCCSFLVWPDLVAYEIILVLDTITKSRIKHLELCFCYASSDESLALQSFCSIIKADMF